eukprot:TRINITY_DN35326_c0_g1_i1.p1 TRINITY_DN35326_c0_g1~~TRINITY_DN35326_c0_g1_i1.p1  ORF type:complete len:220 (+),score=25.99 TRINITY_DN35326_c0_g1_i1:37-660(+)
MIFPLVTAVLLLVSSAYATPPHVAPGYAYAVGDPRASVKLEMFLDLQCPYSNRAWPVIQAVLSHYGTSRVFFVPHVFVIGHHHQAWDAAAALEVVAAWDAAKAIPFITKMFSRQSEFTNGAWLNRTRAELFTLFTSYAAAADIGMPAAAFRRNIALDNATSAVGVNWHYAINVGMAYTPTYLVNGVKVAADSTWTFEQWTSLLDQVV